MYYVVGVALLVAGIVGLDLGRRYLNSIGVQSGSSRAAGGQFIAVLLTMLLGSGMVCLVGGLLDRPGIASTLAFVLSVAITFAAAKLYYRLMSHTPRRPLVTPH